MLQRLRAMLIKEFLELHRDKWAIFRLVVPLLVQMIIYGYAATFTVNHVATAVLDLDHSQVSRDLLSHFTATGRFDIVDTATTQQQIAADINSGKAALAILIHAEFAQRLNDGRKAPLQVVVDGTNSNTALIALGYVSQVVTQFQLEQSRRVWSRDTSAATPQVVVALQERPWFNPSLEDRWFFIPGVIGTLALVQIVNLTSFAIVREREMGTLEQIMVSPIRRSEFILGKTLPFFLIGLADVALVTIVGAVWFHVPFRGSPLVMLIGASLFLLAALGLGLLMSTFSRTQQQAFALNFFIINPYFILSGFAFPISAMPKLLQWFTLINPLRYFIVAMRGVFLKGVGMDVLLPEFAALAALAVVMLSLSMLRFRKSLD
jgi:ABC-2 type transport system permease protein